MPAFTADEEADLISLVQERRLVWDIKHPHYHRRDLKELAFKEIASAMGGKFTVVQLRNKFSNLRTQFTREKRKIRQKSGAGPDDIYQPRWVHFERLLFLNGSCVSLHSISDAHTDEELIEHNPDAIQDDELGSGDQEVESDRVSTCSRDTEGALDYSTPCRPAAPRTAARKEENR
ncbi:hypothetical protein MTO96_043166 [Rhipicephalus appendiculatus]